MDLCDPYLAYLSGVCFSSANLSMPLQKQIHFVRIESILPQHLVQLIIQRDYDCMGPFIHNLDAENHKQTSALEQKEIVLTNGELYILSIL